MTELEVRAPASSLPSLAPSRAASQSTRRFGRMIDKAWIHLLLIALMGVFLFPFAYMVATSLKTDEELMQPDWLPPVPRFVGQSPRVRATAMAAKPLEVSQEKWEAVRPELTNVTRAAVDAAPLPAAAAGVDGESYRTACVQLLLSRVVPRLNLDLWAGETSAIMDAFKASLSPGVVAD